MRINLLINILLVQIFFPLSKALAHFGLADGEDVGHGIFWAYGIVFITLIGFIFYRRFDRRRATPEQQSLRLQLKELNVALNNCFKQIQNADEYPNECGLSIEQRKKNLDATKLIQDQIDHTKEMLSAT